MSATTTTTPAKPTQHEQKKAEQAMRAKMAASPMLFISNLFVQPGRRYHDVMADFQRRDFPVLCKSFLAVVAGVKPDPPRLWIERTKGCSKDTDLSALVLHALLFSPRPIEIQIAAADQDQADELRKAANVLVRLNKHLIPKHIEVLASGIRNTLTGSACEVLTADDDGSHGKRPDVVILNELTHIKNENFALTLLDNATKMPNCVVVIATNAGHVGTWQERQRNIAIESDRWYFSKVDRPAPWIDPAELEDAKKRNHPNRFARLFMGEWTSDTANAISGDDLRAAITSARPTRRTEMQYFGGLDLGHTRDAAAFVVLSRSVGREVRKAVEHSRLSPVFEAMADLGIIDTAPQDDYQSTWVEGDGRLMVHAVHLWKPTPGRPVSFEAVEASVIAAHREYKLAWLWVDPWNAAQMLERFGKAGVPSGKLDFVAANLQRMATETMNCFRDRQISIPDCVPNATDLIADLRAVKCLERQQGFRLIAPRRNTDEGTRHGDAATALQLALVAAADGCCRAASQTVAGPLLCWP